MTQRVGIRDALRARVGDGLLQAASRFRPLTGPRGGALRPLDVPRPFADAGRGQGLLEGRWAYGSQSIDVGAHGHPFSVALPSERFAAWVHGFDWVGDLFGVPGGEAKAAQLARQWSGLYTGSNPFVFAPDLLALRLLNAGRMLEGLAGSVDDPSDTVTARYNSQARRLRAMLPRLSPGLPALRGPAALVIHAARLPESGRLVLARALDALDAQAELQVLADGGHVSRSPAATMDALDILSSVDAVLGAAGLEGSRSLSRAVDRLRPMVATLRHTDGGLALFHGGDARDPRKIDALLSGGDAQPFSYGPHSGYHRLEAGGTVALVDTGGVAPRPFDLDAHLAPLSVEVSTQEGRLLTNCGWHPTAAADWRRPVRSSAAHCALTLADRSPGEILEDGFVADSVGAAVAVEPENVRARRKEQASGIWLESSHDGYKEAHGLVHRRRLFVGETGDDIRGEDSLFVPMGDVPVSRDPVPFTIRFHFHPDVRVSLAQDLTSALLVQKGRTAWRFRTDGGPLVVEPSVYLGASARPVRCQQLVIAGRAMSDGDGQARANRVRWSLRRLTEPSA
ncbi:MAG: heparinase II/III family protein [Pseudomonadota bacterium]